MTHSIRVYCFWSGYQELHELLVVGPYPTAEDRDRDLIRLAGLDDMYGSAQLAPSNIDPASANYRATPAQVANIVDLGGLSEALYATSTAT